MSYLKTAAVAALIAAGALGAGMTAANAGGKHHHHGLHRHGFGAIVIGTPGYGYNCGYWLRKYKWTGNPFYLKRYNACLY